jgi:hypothetical protein
VKAVKGDPKGDGYSVKEIVGKTVQGRDLKKIKII